ncbi:hypothetical protein L6V77_13965 [Myxococcota bacterium]|nr:hypothetical protein [Myxococcota bacterium]
MRSTRRCALSVRVRDILVTVLAGATLAACESADGSTSADAALGGASPGPGSGGTAGGAPGGAAEIGGTPGAGGFPDVAPPDDPLAPDPEDEPAAETPEAAGPLGPDPAACEELDPEDAPADLCAPGQDGAGGADGEGEPPDEPPENPGPPPADCAVADDVCDEPDFCPPGTDPDCADLDAGEGEIDPDCPLPDGLCDEPDFCLPGTDPDCVMSAVPPPVDPGCAVADGFCDSPEPCPPGTDADCPDFSVEPEPEPEPESPPDLDALGYGGSDSCEGFNFDDECDVDLGNCPPNTDATDCALFGVNLPVDGGDGEAPYCPDPFAALGTCTVVCCDQSQFVLQTPDAGTCAQQWRKCRGHRQTVGIGYAAPGCDESKVLFRRGPACRECCARCQKARRYKFVDVNRKCTAAARMFCDDDRRGGLRRARWGHCGGPRVDLDEVLGGGFSSEDDEEFDP